MAKRDKIVFLDAGTVDYGDVSLAELRRLGDFQAFPFTQPAQIRRRASRATLIITNKCRFDRALLGGLETLKSIHLTATGVNNIDLAAAREKGIAVTNVRDYCTELVAQNTMAFILALAGSLADYNRAAHSGAWSRSRHFMLAGFPMTELRGKILGIVGYGHIGRAVARLAKAFGMEIRVARIPGRPYVKAERGRVGLDRLARVADFLTIHAPLTPLTRDLIDAKVIRKMKLGAYLVNTARGGIVNEHALAAALRKGRLGGAACDVLSQEPPPPGHPLVGAPRLLLTPHVAWAGPEVRRRVVREVAMNIRAFQAGRRRNRVD